jgi:hypothetical protein
MIRLSKKLMKTYPSFPYNEIDGILLDILKPNDFVLVETQKTYMIKQIQSISKGRAFFFETPEPQMIDKKLLSLRECIPSFIIFNDITIKGLYELQNSSKDGYDRVIHILKWLTDETINR